MRIEWNKKIAIMVVIACLLLLSIGSAFLIIQHYSSYDFPEGPEKTIIMASAGAEVNLTEAQHIDYEYAKTVLASENMTVENVTIFPLRNYFDSGIDVYFFAEEHTKYDRLWIEVSVDYNNTKAGISIAHESVYKIDVPQEKALLKEKIEFVANACNLTVDWSTLTWSFSYQD